MNDIKLRNSGTTINISRLPDSFIDTMIETVEELKDNPIQILVSYAYIFCGLTLEEIRDRIIIIDNNKPRFISKEFIRKNIKNFYETIQQNYNKLYGDNLIATLYFGNDNFEYTSATDLRQLPILKELDDDYTEIPTPKKTKIKYFSKEETNPTIEDEDSFPFESE